MVILPREWCTAVWYVFIPTAFDTHLACVWGLPSYGTLHDLGR